MSPKKIGIAMSGGVDSTATALILKKEAEVCGFFMHLAQPDYDIQLEKVQSIATKIDLPLKVIDLRESFNQEVLSYFRNTYFEGLTPNPCMVCNRKIKFGLFQEAILNSGMDLMATGHYARIITDSAGPHLHKGIDPIKDQSYFLARLNRQQLTKLQFPLGTFRKSDIYTLVEEYGFHDFGGKESQDVCFLGSEDVGDYLADHYPDKVAPGPIETVSGKLLGMHKGLFRYTIGQRRGLGIPDSTPWYVSGMNAGQNKLIVSKDEELFKTQITITDLHWLSGKSPEQGSEFTTRIRYSHKGSPAQIEFQGNDLATLSFSEPQRAVTPGQFAVFYSGSEVIGSGIIV